MIRAGLGLVAGLAAAVLANLAMFRACHLEPCPAGAAQVLPMLAAGTVAGSFVAGVRRAPLLTSAIVAFLIAAAGAPLWSRTPMTSSITWFPGDFVVTGAYRVVLGMASLVLHPLGWFQQFVWTLVVIWPLIVATMVATKAVSWLLSPKRESHRAHVTAAGLLLFVAVVGEWATAQLTWSHEVDSRIATFRLPAHAAAVGVSRHETWARRQLTYRVPQSVGLDEVLTFHADALKGWTPIDRSDLDAIWLDPSRSVVTWVYLAPASAERREHLVHATMTDRDRAVWQHGRRRNSRGQRVVDLMAGS